MSAHTAPDATPATSPRSRWSRRKRVFSASATVLLVTSAAVAAAILWQQDVAVTNGAQASDVRFVDGGGGLPGFATVSVGASGASATITLTGIAGAAMQVTDLLKIQNTDASQAYSIVLGRSAAPNAALTGLTFTVLDGATPVKVYDAATAASATAFTLPASSTYSIRIDVQVADGTAVGSLGNMALRFTIAPA